MPKFKTNKTLQARVALTRNRKLLRKRACSAHLRSKKNSSARARTRSQKVESAASFPWNKLLKNQS